MDSGRRNKEIETSSKLKIALLNNDKKGIKAFMKTGNIHTDISKLDIMHILDKKYKEVMLFIIKYQAVWIDDDVLIGCLKNKWSKIFRTLCENLYQTGGSVNNNNCIIGIIKHCHIDFTKKALLKWGLVFTDQTIPILEYILATDDIKLFEFIDEKTDVQIHLHPDDYFLITKILSLESKHIAKYIRKSGKITKSEEIETIRHIALREHLCAMDNPAAVQLMVITQPEIGGYV